MKHLTKYSWAGIALTLFQAVNAVYAVSLDDLVVIGASFLCLTFLIVTTTKMVISDIRDGRDR